MKRSRLLPLLLALLLLASLLPCAADDGFVLNRETGAIVGYTGSVSELYIPSEIDGVTVRAIGERAFAGNKSIAILHLPSDLPDGIGKEAFAGCAALKYVYGSDYLTSVGDSAFAGCAALGTAALYSVASLGSRVFDGCRSLKTVYTFGLASMGHSVFSGCVSLTSVYFASSKLTSAASDAFAGVPESCCALLPASFTDRQLAAFAALAVSCGLPTGCAVVRESEGIVLDSPAYSTICPLGDKLTLFCSARSAHGEELTYEWYVSSTPNFTECAAVPGAMSARFSPDTETYGMKYYMCVVVSAGGEFYAEPTVRVIKPYPVSVASEALNTCEQTAHSYENEYTSYPDCTHSGCQISYCRACFAEEWTYLPAEGHDFGGWAASESGYARVCKTCGERETLPLLSVMPDLSGGWYFDDALSAISAGIINGRKDAKGAVTFSAGGSVSYAEAVKIASCVHELLTTGFSTLENYGGGQWYESYLRYAEAYGLVAFDTPASWQAPITRADFALLFNAVLSYGDTSAKHAFAAGSIPDVPAGAAYEAAAYNMFSVGILNGRDGGLFAPDAEIMRSEVCAIVIRVLNPAKRV